MTLSKPKYAGEPPRECPCGGAAPNRPKLAKAPRFDECCGRFLSGAAVAPGALELMRSRYTAYVLGDAVYLRETWDPATCPADLDVDVNASDAPRWLGLLIKRHETLDATHAVVEFVARYKQGARGHRLHEISRFTRGEDGRWRYLAGDVSER